MESEDLFNETVQGEFLPQITSTVIKTRDKKQSLKTINLEDSVSFACKYVDKQTINQNTTDSNFNSGVIIPRTNPPVNFQVDSLHTIDFLPDNADSEDEEYFRKHTKTITKLDLRNYESTVKSSSVDYNKENRKNVDFNNEVLICDSDKTLSDSSNTNIGDANMTFIDNLIDNNNDSKLLDVTKLAYELQNIEKNKLQIAGNKESKSLTILSNRVHIIWTGVPVQNNESKPKYEEIRAWLQHNQIIKSFKLKLKAETSTSADLQIIPPSASFHFCNQSGNNYEKSVTALLEPFKDKKLYVVFHPTDSSYHMAHIVVSLENKRFKMYLFGYAEAAKIELLNFTPVSNPQNQSKMMLERNFPDDNRSKKLQLFNSGARTAFVSFFSHQQQVRFQPRSFLLNSKTTKEIKITTISSVNTITFFFLYSDEELRRACRISCSTYPHQEKYNLFNMAHIFTILPEEKDVQQCKLPAYDWRPSLIRQIDSSICHCNINLMPVITKSTKKDFGIDVLDFNLTLNDTGSICTIDQQTNQSSVTGNSTLNNIENLNSKPLYMNSVYSYVDSLSSLNSIVIQKNENYFPPTVINRTSYTGILIRNDNLFQVRWIISDMLLISSNSSPDTCSSRYSLSSWSGNLADSCMRIAMIKGVLKAGDSVLVPVAFQPTVIGRIKCKCIVKVLKENSDSFLEKELDFHGKGIAQDLENCEQNKNLNFYLSPQMLNFISFEPGLPVKKKLYLQSTSDYLQIFLSHLEEPFEVKTKKVIINKGKSLIEIAFNTIEKGIFRNVLILSDDEGNSTFVSLKGELR